jgi:hypothetical protein
MFFPLAEKSIFRSPRHRPPLYLAKVESGISVRAGTRRGQDCPRTRTSVRAVTVGAGWICTSRPRYRSTRRVNKIAPRRAIPSRRNDRPETRCHHALVASAGRVCGFIRTDIRACGFQYHGHRAQFRTGTACNRCAAGDRRLNAALGRIRLRVRPESGTSHVLRAIQRRPVREPEVALAVGAPSASRPPGR